MPIRIQRKRLLDWRMPENTVYVGRPTYWGNPFKIGVDGDDKECIRKFEVTMGEMMKQDIRKYLKGKNLACWCKLDQPCHADVLLKIANQ